MAHHFLALAFSVVISFGQYFDDNTVDYLTETACSAYTCKLPTQDFTDGTCIFYEGTGTPTYYLTNCTLPESPYCPASNALNSTCSAKPTPTVVTHWPGEKCVSNNDCNSYAIYGCATNGICKGASENGACHTNDNCNPGYYCSSSKCVLQLEIGAFGCANDYQCVNNAGCDVKTGGTDGICVEYLSVSAHDPINSCTLSTNNLCRSTMCGEVGGSFYCLDQLSSSDSLPIPCVTNTNCTATRDSTYDTIQIYSPCTCGYNPDAKGYCSLFPGDPLNKKLVDKMTSYVRNPAILYCNTNRRFSTECMDNWWGHRDAATYAYYSAVVSSYAAIQNNQDCVADVFNAQFKAIEQTYQYYENEFANGLAVVLGVVFTSIIV